MTDNYIIAGEERQAGLEAAKAAFFAAGGRATELEAYRAAPLPVRSTRVDPETVLKRRPVPLSRAEKMALRKMADAL